MPANCATMGAECCPESIRLDASSCDTFAPPCLMSRKYTARGRLYGPEKLRKDGIFPENGDIPPLEKPTGQVPQTPKPVPVPEPKKVVPTPKPQPLAKEPTPEPQPTKVEPTPEPKQENKKDDDDDDDKEKKSNGESRPVKSKKGIESGVENSTGEPDPTCLKGVSNKRTCCPASCGKCGGHGCSKRPGGRMCCQKHVRATGRMCKNTSAPCMKML